MINVVTIAVIDDGIADHFFQELQNGKGYTLKNGNSYATAVVTAAIANMMEEMPGATRNQIIYQMRKKYGR